MKNKLLVIFGIFSVVASMTVIAVETVTPSDWRKDMESVSSAIKNAPDDVSKLLSSMQAIVAEKSA